MAHLLLVVVLALGVFIMHTLGHPEGGNDSATAGSSHGVMPGSSHGAMAADHTAMPAHHGATAPSHGAVAAVGEPALLLAPSQGAGAGGKPVHTMDMTSLCVAVLGAWMLGVLAWAAPARFRTRPLAPPAWFAAALRPNPPPPLPPPDLIQLSVLRT
ncbi:hypothetical protein [Streptomyces sp. MST-110588]|uniref:hypothetical protein n=1 Tax=Streptomyces sp. MST-110588 TaxID=2833628 RepID=UPI001F5DE0B9|nr:hypothetical protein [Streptomyces sp. MST-110588]